MARYLLSHALQYLDIFNILRDYTPILAGTIPLDIDIEGSDLDIIFKVYDLSAFQRAVQDAFSAHNGFGIERTIVKDVPTVFARFAFDGFQIEVFGQPQSVVEQNACRHMMVEARLLTIGEEDARREIRRLKLEGLKTEPAFARYFKIEGNPYEALLQWSSLSEQELWKCVWDADKRG